MIHPVGLLALLPLLLPSHASERAAAAPLPVAAGAQGGPAEDALEEEFLELQLRYANAVADYRFQVRQLKRNARPESDYPPLPTAVYAPEYGALAAKGSGRAVAWLLENMGTIEADPQRRTARLRELYTQLFREHATGDYLLESVEQLARSVQTLGRDYVFAELARITDNPQANAEAQARSYFEMARLLNEEAFELGEESEESEQLLQIVVDAYTKTKAAVFASQRLLMRYERRLIGMELAWMDEVRELALAGAGPEAWPTHPIHDLKYLFDGLAETENPNARYWVEVFYPAFEQAWRQAPRDALQWYTTHLTLHYPRRHAHWMNLRLEIQEFLVDLYGDDPWIFGLLEYMDSEYETYTAAEYGPVLRKLFDGGTNERIRDQARLTLAKVLARGQTPPEYTEGMELLRELEDGSSIERIRKEAERVRRDVEWVMPGSVAPDFNVKDAEGFPVNVGDYRGRVVLMHFWGFWNPDCVRELPRVRAVHQALKDQPFAVLGINNDLITREQMRTRCAANDIDWRNGLQVKRWGVVSSAYYVRDFPANVVVDAEGVIRGRFLSLEDSVALCEELLRGMGQEVPVVSLGASGDGELPRGPATLVPSRTKGDAAAAERAAPAPPQVGPATEPAGPATEPAGTPALKAGRGGIRGRVRYAGSAGPLPPLKLAEQQTAGCTHGANVDAEDRRRIVGPDKGLKYTVLTVEVEGLAADGEGQVAVLDQRGCRFEPHVVVVQAGGTLRVLNSDEVTHNVHTYARKNAARNMTVAIGAKTEMELERAEAFKIACDIHPWMGAWVVVVDTPYYAVTDGSGSFSIPDLPPGEYRVEWWHEDDEIGKGRTDVVRVEAGEYTEVAVEAGGESERSGRRPRR